MHKAMYGGQTEDDKLVDLYVRVGLYARWSWTEFIDTPWYVVEGIAEHLKKVAENPEIPLGYGELEVARGIGRAFGGEKSGS